MDNISDIISSLSNEDIDMLKGVASSILSGGEEIHQTNSVTESEKAESNDIGLNVSELDMLLKAKSAFDKMNSSSSKNADLINALKPHLSEESRKKADTAIRVLRLFEILPYLKELF